MTTSKPKIIDMINVLPWNKCGSKWKRRKLNQIKNLVIHQELADGSVKAVNAYHISPECHLGSKVPHICYTWFIENDGTIIQCNEILDITEHVALENTKSLSICVRGLLAYPEDPTITGEPTAKELLALRALIDYIVTLFPGIKLYGHMERQNKKSCPGSALMKFINEYRNSKGVIK
jgi:hypothetical protein